MVIASRCSGVPGIGRVQPLTQSLADEPTATLGWAAGDGVGLGVALTCTDGGGVGEVVAVGSGDGLSVGWLVGAGGSVGGKVVMATGSS
jgi:ABC-type sugar transport system substrate-binding protein